jgi:rRNA-processing protein FCF1
MYIIRSFDINKPGQPIEKLLGGVIGGSVIQGSLSLDDEIEIRPGLPIREKKRIKMKELYTEINSLHVGGGPVKKAIPGGLVGIGTMLDPSITKSDGLVGSLIGKPGTLPPVTSELGLDISLFETVVGSRDMQKVDSIAKGEDLLMNIGTAKTMGKITKVSKEHLEARLTIPVCVDEGDRVAISRRIGGRWRLIGVGILREYVIIDSNFLFIPLQFGVDIFSEFERLLGGLVKCAVPSPVVEELRLVKSCAKPSMKKKIEFALALSERCEKIEERAKSGETVDDVIMRLAKDWNCPVATNDTDLKRRLRNEGIKVIFLRQKSHLEIEGII